MNPRHPDLMTGTLTTELPRQPQWSESNISYKGNIDHQTFAPRPLGLGITSVGRRDQLIGPDVIDHTMCNTAYFEQIVHHQRGKSLHLVFGPQRTSKVKSKNLNIYTELKKKNSKH